MIKPEEALCKVYSIGFWRNQFFPDLALRKWPHDRAFEDQVAQGGEAGHQTFEDDQVKALLGWKSKGFYEWRLCALVCLIIDTGVRIEEALTVELSKVDLDNLLITVYGNGSKERIVPVSSELRKDLWNYLKAGKRPAGYSAARRAGTSTPMTIPFGPGRLLNVRLLAAATLRRQSRFVRN